ncbi:EamA family transporter [Desulfurococcus mucosus]|uniref:EamA family transporter n=1 Tax=Desulfurococcus mucosus TaxID=2275 RepID=UPI00064FD828
MNWVLNIAIAVLAAVNTVFWGYTVREVGDPQLSLSFLLKLVFNKWFIAAIATALVASIMSYAVLREMGVLAGRFFLSLGTVATILAGTLILGEQLTWREWLGVALITVGTLLVGR